MSRQLQWVPLELSVGSLDAYISYVNQIPLLSAEDEQLYAEQFQQNGDLESARRLVLSHLRYVVRVARGYLGYGLPLNDLIQEGNIGLMKAVKRFDPAMGVRLVSFAVHWIKAEIHEFVLKNWRIVKIATTKAQRKLFFNLRQMKNRLGWFTNDEVNAVAQDLGVSREEVLLMEQRLNSQDSSFDGPVFMDAEDDSYKIPANFLEDNRYDPARLIEQEHDDSQDREYLLHALDQIDPRSRDILQLRWLAEDKATLHELAYKYNVSAERIRQLEKNAMHKIRKIMENNII